MKRYNFFLGLFLLSSALELLGFAIDWNEVHLVAKPLIVLALIGYYFAKTEKLSMVFINALLFCWAGDVFLLFQSAVPSFFIFGLLSFMIGHVLYIIAYRNFQWADKSKELLWTQKMRYSLPIIVLGTGLIGVLYPALGALQIPVVVYAVVLMVMVMTALFRYGRTIPASFWMIFSGAALFMTSDAMLALNKFHAPLPHSGILVMLTYISAQYLIVEGVLRHK